MKISARCLLLPIGLAALVATAPLGGCIGLGSGGGSGSGGGGGGQGGTTAANVEQHHQSAATHVSKAFCRGLFECPRKQQFVPTAYLGRFADQASCRQHFDEHPNVLLPDSVDLERAVAQGRASFDADAAADCLQQLQQVADGASCPADPLVVASMGPCAQVVQGTLQARDACLIDEECATGRCSRTASDVCFGECTDDGAPLGQGEVCFYSNECDRSQHLTCGPSGNGSEEVCLAAHSLSNGDDCADDYQCPELSTCFDGVCSELPAYPNSGETCMPSEFLFCAPGTACRDIEETSQGEWQGSCGTVGQKGDTCMTRFGCAVGLYCKGADPEQGQQGTCQPVIKAGETCTEDRECGVVSECLGPDGNKECMPEWQYYSEQDCELPE